jgi:hypothetical protein
MYTVKQMEDLGVLRTYSRDPFRKALAQWLKNGPSEDAILAQATKHPERWAQGLTMLGRLSGYTEKLEVDVAGEIHHLHQLSDLELEAELVRLQARLDQLPAPSSTVLDLPAAEAKRA